MTAVATSAGRTASPGDSPPRRFRHRRDVADGGSPRRHRWEADDDDWRRLLRAVADCMALVVLGSGLVLVARRTADAFPAPDLSGSAGQTGAVVSIAPALVGGLLVLLVDVLVPGGAGPAAWATPLPRSRSTRAKWIARLGLALVLAAVLPPPVGLVGWGGPSAPILRVAGMAAFAFAVATLVAPLARTLAGSPRHRLDRSDRVPAGRRQAGHHPPPRAPATRWPDDAPSPTRPREDAAMPPTAGAPLEAAGPLDPPIQSDAASLEWPQVSSGGAIQQRFERILLADEGIDCLRGTIHLSVVAGTRSATGHVGFCPPFHAVPHVEVGTRSEAVEAAIMAAEILPWGVRVECRLDDTADETILIPVDVVARAPLGPTDDPASPPPSPSAPHERHHGTLA